MKKYSNCPLCNKVLIKKLSFLDCPVPSSNFIGTHFAQYHSDNSVIIALSNYYLIIFEDKTDIYSYDTNLILTINQSMPIQSEDIMSDKIKIYLLYS
jgi:hypothetical protein